MSEHTIPYSLEPATVVTSIEPDQSDLIDGPLAVLAANGPNGLETEVIDIRDTVPYAFPPRNVTTRTVTDIASFVSEVDDRPLITGHDRVRSTVWGNRLDGTITAIYDDVPADAVAEYQRRGDRLKLQFVRNVDWLDMLRAADGDWHEQEEFGDLIEAAGHLIVSHAAAELIEIVDTIRASSSGTFDSKIHRGNGSVTLNYNEDVTVTSGGRGSKAIEVPREVTFRAAPFEDYPTVVVTCWLRVRVRNGDLRLGLFPQPYEHKIRESWTEVVDDVAGRISHTIYTANVK